MGALTAARQQIKAGLDGAPGVPRVYDVLPTTFTPPCVIFAPGDPWIDGTDAPRGVGRVTWVVRVLAGIGTNVAAHNALTDLVEAVWDALNAASTEWVPTTVSPITYQLDDGRAYLGADIAVTNTIRTTS